VNYTMGHNGNFEHIIIFLVSGGRLVTHDGRPITPFGFLRGHKFNIITLKIFSVSGGLVDVFCLHHFFNASG